MRPEVLTHCHCSLLHSLSTLRARTARLVAAGELASCELVVAPLPAPRGRGTYLYLLPVPVPVETSTYPDPVPNYLLPTVPTAYPRRGGSASQECAEHEIGTIDECMRSNVKVRLYRGVGGSAAGTPRWPQSSDIAEAASLHVTLPYLRGAERHTSGTHQRCPSI